MLALQRARRKQSKKLYAAGYLGTPQQSGFKRHTVLAVCNVVGAVGLLGLISYSFFTDRLQPTANAKSDAMLVEVRVEKTRAVSEAPVGSIAMASLGPRAALPVPQATGSIPLARAPARVSTPSNATIHLRNTLVDDLGGAGLFDGDVAISGDIRRVVIGNADVAEPVRVASIGSVADVLPTRREGAANGDNISFGSLFRDPNFDVRGSLRDATPAPAPVPLTRRGESGAVLVLSFAASPFGVRDVEAEGRGDLMAAEEVARNSIEEDANSKDRRVARERYCLAAAIYYEARGEPISGQQAVAQVVLNRVEDSRYPGSICGVVFQDENRRHRCQFSFACDGKPERPKPGASWNKSQELAREFLNGYTHEPVAGATHYHADYVRPRWSRSNDMSRVGKIGRHIFYTES